MLLSSRARPALLRCVDRVPSPSGGGETTAAGPWSSEGTPSTRWHLTRASCLQGLKRMVPPGTRSYARKNVTAAMDRASASLVARTSTSPWYVLVRQWSDVLLIGSSRQKGIGAFPLGSQSISSVQSKKTLSLGDEGERQHDDTSREH